MVFPWLLHLNAIYLGDEEARGVGGSQHIYEKVICQDIKLLHFLTLENKYKRDMNIESGDRWIYRSISYLSTNPFD